MILDHNLFQVSPYIDKKGYIKFRKRLYDIKKLQKSIDH